jgi:hypothetical protein
MKHLLYAGMLALCMVSGGKTTLAQTSAIAPDGTDRFLGTIQTKFSPQFSNGRLNGCSLEFYALGRDWAYRQGGLTHFGGHIAFYVQDRTPAFTFKLVLSDLNASLERLPTQPPTVAYIIHGLSTNQEEVVSSQPSDTPGALFSVFRPLKTFEILIQSLDAGVLGIRYARNQGGIEAPLNIDLRVDQLAASGERDLRGRNSGQLMPCIQKLLAEMQ